MNQDVNSISQKEINIKWMDEISRMFIEMFLAQLDKENWVDKALTKYGKLSVRKSFKEATGFDLLWKNFTNHLRNLKLGKSICGYTGVTIDHATGIINMGKEWWDERIQENELAKRFRKRSLANKDLLEKLFSGTRIGVEDGWSVGNGPDVYRPQYKHEHVQFDINTPYVVEDRDESCPTPHDELTQTIESTPNIMRSPSDERLQHDQRNKRKRGSSNNNNQSDLSKALSERSDALKMAASEMSSALASDVTLAARRLHQIPEIEFCTSFYWDATNLLSEDEIVRKWFIGISDNKFALIYLEQKIGRKHYE